MLCNLRVAGKDLLKKGKLWILNKGENLFPGSAESHMHDGPDISKREYHISGEGLQ